MLPLGRQIHVATTGAHSDSAPCLKKPPLNLTRLLRLRGVDNGLFSRDFIGLTLKRALRIFLERFEVIVSSGIRLPH